MTYTSNAMRHFGKILREKAGDHAARFPEESHARELHSALEAAVKPSAYSVKLSVEIAGTQSRCLVQGDTSAVRINCFDLNGPEYLAAFTRDGGPAIFARTSMQSEIIAAALDWLSGQLPSQFSESHSCVEPRRRELSILADQIQASLPGLRPELQHTTCDLYDLRIRHGDRDCKAFIFGKDPVPVAAFHWEQCELFRVHTGDTARLICLLRSWLLDHAPPSTLRREYPDLDIGPLADEYEQGTGVEGEFMQSWDHTETFLAGLTFSFGPQILMLMQAMREAGYSRSLRAGTSMYNLILSRSRRHGLRAGQPSISFAFSDNQMILRPYLPEAAGEIHQVIRWSDELDRLLQALAAHPID